MRDTFPLLVKTEFPTVFRNRIDTVQANLGYRCNQSCTHCHVAAGPHRTEEMRWETMELLLRYLKDGGRRDGMWRTVARLLRIGEPARALRLAATLAGAN